jgi:hypothetical protein
VAPDAARRALCAALLLAAGCGGKTKEPEVDLAAIRARRDSVQRVARLTAAATRYTTCADSVTAALAKTTRKKTPVAPAGTVPPEVVQACGSPPAASTTVAVARPADSGTRAPVTAARDTAKAPAKPAQTAAAPPATVPAAKPAATPPAQPGAKPALSPQQQQVARADSVRLARERTRADSLAAVAARAREDSISRAARDSVRADSIRLARETEVTRETFTYGGGARDPFQSLISEDKVGPEFGDLLLVGVYLDLRRTGNSLAVLRDKTNQKRYKLRVGDRLGRLKVAQIRQTDVVFTVEDIGFERQETLSLRKKEDETP